MKEPFQNPSHVYLREEHSKRIADLIVIAKSDNNYIKQQALHTQNVFPRDICQR